MRATLTAIALVGALLCSEVLTGGVQAATLSGLPLPRRSRAVGPNHYISAKTFRKTVVFFRRHLSKRGYQHKEIPATGYRGVVVSRFLAVGPSPWLAIHVFRVAGKTHIYVVPKPAEKAADKALDPPPSSR